MDRNQENALCRRRQSAGNGIVVDERALSSTTRGKNSAVVDDMASVKGFRRRQPSCRRRQVPENAKSACNRLRKIFLGDLLGFSTPEIFSRYFSSL